MWCIAAGLAAWWILILGRGHDHSPGWRAGWSEVPRASGRSGSAGHVLAAGQSACDSAVMRVQAVAMSSAHGQAAAIFRYRRRPPRTSRAGVCRMR